MYNMPSFGGIYFLTSFLSRSDRVKKGQTSKILTDLDVVIFYLSYDTSRGALYFNYSELQGIEHDKFTFSYHFDLELGQIRSKYKIADRNKFS